MRMCIVAGLCALLLISAIPVFADDGEGLAGKSEIMAAAAWAKVTAGSDSGTLTLAGATYGKFLNSNVEAQLGIIYAQVTDLPDIGGDIKATMLTPAVAYHFLSGEGSSTVPYIGAGAVYARLTSGGTTETSTKAQYFAGVKLFIGGDYTTANKAVFLEYRRTNVELEGANSTVDMVWAGISTIF